MPVEFALRPRIRLRETPAPARRVRARLPKFALPALAYWLGIGALVYEYVNYHDSSAPPAETETSLALPVASPPVVRQWWRPLPAPAAPEHRPARPAEPSVSEPELQAAPPEAPIAEFRASEISTADLSDPELPATPLAAQAPLATEAPHATNRRRARSAQAREAAPPLGGPTTAPEREVTPDNVGVPAPPLVFAPLDEPVPAHAFTPTASPTRPADTSRVSGGSGLPSCESAATSASQDVDFSGGNRAADLPTQAIAAVLENGAWLTSCNVPERTALDVCVAIKDGRVVGASVYSRPADSALNNCVKRRASSLQFPYSPRLDVARTRF